MTMPDTLIASIKIDEVEAAAGTDDIWYLVVPQSGTWELDELTFVPENTVTANDTNYTTITAKKGATALATFNTTIATGTAHTLATPIALSITGTGQDLEFTNSTPLIIDKTDSGSGQISAGTYSAKFTRVRV